MQRRKCISCGYIIMKSALHDPYVCRDCEDLMIGPGERYMYLDNKAQEVKNDKLQKTL